MRGGDILLERADRNRKKCLETFDKISKIAKSKANWCEFVTCEWSMQDGYTLTFIRADKKIKVRAKDFFDNYSMYKSVSESELLNMEIDGD